MGDEDMSLDVEMEGALLESMGTGWDEAATAATATAAQDRGQAVEQWNRFLAQCISARLDPEPFESFVTILNSKHPLPPPAIADIFLRPQPSNHESLDPRIPRYIQVLSHRRLIDAPSILKAMYRYSTSHTQAQRAGHPPLEDEHADVRPGEPGVKMEGGGTATGTRPVTLRWGSSYASEEVIFYRLTKAVGLGAGIKGASDALDVCKVIARWMSLFTSASAAFTQDVMGQLQSTQSRDEMEAARAAFVMLLLSVCENQTVLSALSRPVAKGMSRTL